MSVSVVGDVPDQTSQTRHWRPSRRLLGALAGVLVTLYLAAVTFPATYLAHGRSLDPGWRFAINYAAAHGIPFGSEVNFTYGPLGYLVTPMDIGGNLPVAVAFWFLVQALFVGALAAHIVMAKRAWPTIAFGVMYLIAAAFDLTSEYHLVAVVAVVLSVALVSKRPAAVAAAGLGGALAGTLLFVKFTLGVATIGMIAAAVLVWVARDRSAAWRNVGAVAGGWMLAVGLVVAINFGSLENLATWFSTSVEMSKGYSATMGFLPIVPVMSLVALAVLVVLAVVLVATGERIAAAMALLVAPALFVAFKHAYVRHGNRFFTPVIIVTAALMLLTAAGKRGRVIAALGAVAIVAVGAPVGCSSDRAAACKRDGVVAVAGTKSLGGLNKTLHLAATRRALEAESRAALAGVELPERVLTRLREPGVTVDALPWDLTVIDAFGLRWVPNPALQLYNAATPRLDAKVARHYRGAKAPTYIIWQFAAIDGRHPFLEAPRTLRAILAHYEVVDVAPAIYILRRRAMPLEPHERTLGDSVVRPGTWIAVPRSDAYVLARIEITRTLAGTLRQTFLSTNPVTLEVRYASGSVMRARISPELADGGFLIGGLPSRSRRTAMDFWYGKPAPPSRRVVAIRLSGPGLASYERDMTLRWIEVRGWFAKS